MKGNCLLAAALLVSFLGALGTEAHAGDGTKALSLLPQDTAVVVVWNLARSRNSQAGVELIAAVTQNQSIGGDVQRFRDKAGIDWKQDLDTVVLGMGPAVSMDAPYVLVVEGRFDRDKILATARAGKGFVAREHWGVSYYQSGNIEIAFLNEQWVIARRGAITRVIDVFRGKARSVRNNQDLMALFRTTDVAQDMWCVFRVPRALREEMAQETGGHSIDQGSASVDLEDIPSKQVRARVRLNLSSRPAVVALGILLQTQGPQDQTIQAMGLAPALRAMTISRKDTNMDLTLRPSKADMAKLGRFLRSWRPSSS